MLKPHGWCILHYFTITHEKYVRHCSKALKGRKCKQFTRAIPEWVKKGDRHA